MLNTNIRAILKTVS